MPLLRPWEAPLLLKELTELAARRRTYVIRFAYALGLFAVGLVILFGRAANSQNVFGHGRSLFLTLVWFQQLAIMLLVPAMTASALTIEKERETLPLLLLTRITAVEIILEKFLSRVAPVISYVMLSFPLMAVAYSYGGVTTSDLASACAMLIVTVIYEAAFSLLCSAWFRTTIEAFIAVYAGQVLLWALTCGLVPLTTIVMGRSPGTAGEASVMIGSTRMLLLSVLYLTGAILVLHSRAFVPQRNVLLLLFRRLDRMFNEWNVVTGGVVLVNDGDQLPVDRPVAWRETVKRSLGTFRYLVRVLVVIELPILLISQMVNIDMIRGHRAMTWVWYTLWVAAGAMICLHASNVIASERSRQTLDVLLATPMSGRSLLLEKLAGVRRLLFTLCVPFATVIAFQHWFRDYKWNLAYPLQSAALMIVLGWMAMWLAFRIGLSTKSPMAGMFVSFGAAVALCGLPLLLSFAARTLLNGPLATSLVALFSLNPVTLLEMVESTSPDADRAAQGWSPRLYPWGFAAAIVMYLFLGLLIRRHCLRRADDLLGRAWRDSSRPAPALD